MNNNYYENANVQLKRYSNFHVHVTMSALYGAIVDPLVLSKNTAQLKSDSTCTLLGLNSRIDVSHLTQERTPGLMFLPESKCSRIAIEANEEFTS